MLCLYCCYQNVHVPWSWICREMNAGSRGPSGEEPFTQKMMSVKSGRYVHVKLQPLLTPLNTRYFGHSSVFSSSMCLGKRRASVVEIVSFGEFRRGSPLPKWWPIIWSTQSHETSTALIKSSRIFAIIETMLLLMIMKWILTRCKDNSSGVYIRLSDRNPHWYFQDCVYICLSRSLTLVSQGDH